MMKSFVWDTGPLILYFDNHEETVSLMKKTITRGNNNYIPQIVFIEFYYKTWNAFGHQTAKIQSINLRETTLIEHILTEKDLYTAGEAILKYSFLSLADAIVVATAKATKSQIITTDGDFRDVKGIKTIKLEF